ncbi:MAG: HD domain-containing phosphohydrolase [bacterium]
MQYARVNIPILQVRAIRRVETGTTLEYAAITQDGTLVAEAGETIDEELLKRLKNFGVRKIVALEPQIQWIPASETDTLPSEAEVLEREEFSEAAAEIVDELQETNSIQQMRKTALYMRRQASLNGDEEAVDQLDEMIERTDRLEQEISDLKDQLQDVEDEEAREQIMEALESKVRKLEKTFLEMNAPDSLINDTVDAVQEKEEIRTDLSDFAHNNTELLNERESITEVEAEERQVELEEDPVDRAVNECLEGDTASAVKYVNEKSKDIPHISHEVESELDELHKSLTNEREKSDQFKELLKKEVDDLSMRKTLLDVIEGRKSVDRKKLMTMPIPQNLANEIYQFLDERMENRNDAWEVMDQASDGELEEEIDKSTFMNQSMREPDPAVEDPGEDIEGNLSRESMVEVMDSMSDGDIEDGLQQLEQEIEDSDQLGPSAGAKISVHREKLNDIDQRVNELKQRVNEEVESEEDREVLLAMLVGDREFDPEQLMEIDADVQLLEDVGDCLTDRQEHRSDLWSTMNQVSDGMLYGDDGEQGSSALDAKVSSAEEQLNVGSSESSDRESSDSEITGPVWKQFREIDPYDVANETGLDLQTVKNAKTLLVEPEEMNGDQQVLFHSLCQEAKKSFFGESLNEQKIKEFVKETIHKVENHNRPLKLLVEPPSPDRHLLSHGLNTSLVSIIIGMYLDLQQDEMMDLAAASMTLDFGMTEIPATLWLNDEDLSARGQKEIQKHPKFSSERVEEVVGGDSVVEDLVSQHHSRLDGSGYPYGLEKDDQHPLAPVLALADSYTAMLEPREHRSPINPDKAAISIIRKKSKYDRTAVQGLLRRIGLYPNGTVVMTSDGRLCMVREQTPGSPKSPKLFAITDANQNKLADPVPLDLSDRNDISIKKLVRR